MATSTQVAQLQDTQKSVLSLLLSLSPLYFLVTARCELLLSLRSPPHLWSLLV